ncbi:LysM peptidoglycan-binding domain-containing protein [Streptomyces sp. NPDC090054]|uniref:LysM peptidoglycan-binding domain-containing protein n=1 Tax=Streptomyces sp. NPDC090054 TaxID=3365933 RepID=UPI0037F8FFFE
MPKPTPPRTPARPARSGARTAAAILRALLSLTVLAALIVGLPALLWWATTIVGPPGLAALSSLLSTDDSGQVFLLLLAAAGWIGWACFAVAVLLEIPAQLRGRAAPQIRGLVGQRAAAVLVGAIFVALPTGTALAAPSLAPPATAQPAAVSATSTPGAPSEARQATGTTAEAEVTHRVRDARPAESLWSIAEQRLGDGEKWTDIAALNTGRTMTDGQVFDADQPIHPGWILHLPPTATTPTPPAPDAAPAAATSTEVPATAAPAVATPTTNLAAQGNRSESAVGAAYTVRDGDSLSSIAGEQLGNRDRFHEIWELNQGAPLPDGGVFTDPDLIYPGQQLTLPEGGKPQEAAPPDGRFEAPVTPTPSPAVTPSATASTPPARTAPSPTPPAKASPATTPTPTAPVATAPQHTPATSPTAPATQVPKPPSASATPAAVSEAQPAADHVNWALVGGVGTLLAASLAGALGVRRILQQRTRRAGQTIAQDADPTDTEQVLEAAAEHEGVELLDQVLRALARQAAEDDVELPTLRGAHLTADGITLLLDEPATAIAPFLAGDDARTWILDGKAVLPSADDLADVQAPYPGLVTLGASADGLLLADLTTCRVLLLDGTEEEALEVGRALALELGTCAWTDYNEILTTGLGSRLAGLLPQGRIRSMPHLPAVAADLGELLLEAHQNGEQALPWMVIGAGDHDEDHVTQLADALAAARDLFTAVVLPATPATRRAFPHAEMLDTTRDTEARLDPLDLPVTLQRVTDEQYRQYVHALQVTTEDANGATGAWEFTESHDQAAAAGTPLTVRVTSEDATDPGKPYAALLAGLNPSTEASTTPQTAGETVKPSDPEVTGPVVGAASMPNQSGGESDSAPASPVATPAATAGSVVRIEMLGPLRITGTAVSAHSSRTTAIAALIHLRPGRSVESLCQMVDPISPWSTRTLHSRLSELRGAIGTTTEGQPPLSRPKAGIGYTFHPTVTSDWEAFKALASRGLTAGPNAGIADLETAMALVRGKPFDGRTPPWAEPVVQEMMARITDTAHTLAHWHTDSDHPDLDAARRTIHRALEVEVTSEVLYRDLLTIEWTAQNTAAIHKTVARLQQMARTYDITLDEITEDTINRVLSTQPASTARQVTTA